MSVKAYPVKKELHEDYIQRRTILYPSFDLWTLSIEEEALLKTCLFWDNTGGNGPTFAHVGKDNLKEAKREAKEINYTGRLLAIIEKDLELYGIDGCIEYQCI